MTNENMTPVSGNDRVDFSCTPDVSCFNACCRDLNQFLTPYDILRIKKRLGITSTEFLARYCSRHTGPQSGLPIVTLKPGDSRELTCPFLTADGCGIYPHRPSSCRMYPLVRAISRSRETGEVVEQFMVLKEPHCKGFDRGAPIRVEDLVTRQGLKIYNEFNDMLMEIISIKNQLISGPLDLSTGQLFSLACYDLDAFRSHVYEKNILSGLDFHTGELEEAETNDEALLAMGMEAVRQTLLGARR